MVLEAVGVLGPLSSSLSSEEEEEKGSGDVFLESSAAETLPEERLTMRRSRERPLWWTRLPALELERENKLSESGDSPTLGGMAWGSGG